MMPSANVQRKGPEQAVMRAKLTLQDEEQCTAPAGLQLLSSAPLALAQRGLGSARRQRRRPEAAQLLAPVAPRAQTPPRL